MFWKQNETVFAKQNEKSQLQNRSENASIFVRKYATSEPPFAASRYFSTFETFWTQGKCSNGLPVGLDGKSDFRCPDFRESSTIRIPKFVTTPTESRECTEVGIFLRIENPTNIYSQWHTIKRVYNMLFFYLNDQLINIRMDVPSTIAKRNRVRRVEDVTRFINLLIHLLISRLNSLVSINSFSDIFIRISTLRWHYFWSFGVVKFKRWVMAGSILWKQFFAAVCPTRSI